MKRLRSQPAWQFTAVLFSVFVCELIVMVALHFLQIDSRLAIAIGSAMLSLLIFPVLSVLLLRPQKRHIQFMNQVLDSLCHPFYVINVDDYTIEKANAAAQEVIRNNPGALTCHQASHRSGIPCNSSEHECIIEKIKRSGKPETVEHIHFDKDGNPRNIEVHGFPIYDKSGKLVQVIEYGLDVTEISDARKKVLEASQAKSDFLANMSHEVRTPMNSIIGFGDLLLDSGLNAEQIDYALTMYSSARALLTLINDILDYSKIEAGKLTLETINVKPGTMLHHIEAMIKPQADQKQIEMKVNCSDRLPEFIQTDPTRLSQCLINLTNNALKFTKKGHVHINVSNEILNSQPAIRFDVEDTGIGIPKEKQALIFQSFTQADGSTTRKFGGTGLGLAITQKIIELMGGQLSLKSTPGEGSIFTLIVPTTVNGLSQGEIMDTPQNSPISRKMYSAKVLVAEDNLANQMLIKTLLSKHGIEATVVDNGQKAIEAIRGQDFAMIFMDMQMPVMNGYEATQALRQDGFKTPIIALTANAMSGDREKCLEAGCDNYLSKPIDRQKLQDILEESLGSKDLDKQVDLLHEQTQELSQLVDGATPTEPQSILNNEREDS